MLLRQCLGIHSIIPILSRGRSKDVEASGSAVSRVEQPMYLPSQCAMMLTLRIPPVSSSGGSWPLHTKPDVQRGHAGHVRAPPLRHGHGPALPVPLRTGLWQKVGSSPTRPRPSWDVQSPIRISSAVCDQLLLTMVALDNVSMNPLFTDSRYWSDYFDWWMFFSDSSAKYRACASCSFRLYPQTQYKDNSLLLAAHRAKDRAN